MENPAVHNPTTDIEWLWNQYGGRLHAFVLVLTCSPADTEEVLQNVFLGLVKAGPTLAKVDKIKPYLYQVARNETYRFLSARRHEVPLEELDPVLLVASPNHPEQAIDLTRALARLPIEQREVVVLKTYHNLTFAEIGQLINISQNTAASRYRYGLARLRVDLNPLVVKKE